MDDTRTRVQSLPSRFPTDQAAIKLLFLVLRDVNKNWKMLQREWTIARTLFAILFGKRFNVL